MQNKVYNFFQSHKFSNKQSTAFKQKLGQARFAKTILVALAKKNTFVSNISEFQQQALCGESRLAVSDLARIIFQKIQSIILKQ